MNGYLLILPALVMIGVVGFLVVLAIGSKKSANREKEESGE